MSVEYSRINIIHADSQREIGEECSICQEEISPSSQTALPCGHKFHTECITTNRGFNGAVCPNCRRGYNSPSETSLTCLQRTAAEDRQLTLLELIKKYKWVFVVTNCIICIIFVNVYFATEKKIFQTTCQTDNLLVTSKHCCVETTIASEELCGECQTINWTYLTSTKNSDDVEKYDMTHTCLPDYDLCVSGYKNIYSKYVIGSNSSLPCYSDGTTLRTGISEFDIGNFITSGMLVLIVVIMITMTELVIFKFFILYYYRRLHGPD
jgi:hypothetical protein